MIVLDLAQPAFCILEFIKNYFDTKFIQKFEKIVINR